MLTYVRLEALNTAKGNPGYVVRLDMTADDVVDVSDVLGFIPYLNTICSQ